MATTGSFSGSGSERANVPGKGIGEWHQKGAAYSYGQNSNGYNSNSYSSRKKGEHNTNSYGEHDFGEQLLNAQRELPAKLLVKKSDKQMREEFH